MKDGGREWTGRLVSQAHSESRGEEGGGRVSWAMEVAGNSLPRNFSYRAVGPPSGPKQLLVLRKNRLKLFLSGSVCVSAARRIGMLGWE